MTETAIQMLGIAALCIAMLIIMVLVVCIIIAYTRGIEDNIGSLADEERDHETRGVCHAPNRCLGYEETGKVLAELEAAKRELAKSRAGGNTAKLREALDEILERIDAWRTDGTLEHWQYSQLFDLADGALAVPARNCDVGTPDEQAKRFEQFCGSVGLCVKCELDNPGACPTCGVRWSQWTKAPANEDKAQGA